MSFRADDKIRLVAAVILAVVVGFIAALAVPTANASDGYDKDLFESRREFSDGVVLQCAGRKDHIDCNWDRYNKELEERRQK